ncbi:YraN family protein [bacterium]|nr:YraN family protein [bacterium]
MPSPIGRIKLGRLGEEVAAGFLLEKGYRIRERNYRCRIGEIDLIADHKEYLVFVEVKSRYYSTIMVNPLISITQKKRQKLRLLGQTYLIQRNIRSKQPRFDVITIIFKSDKQYALEHIENAF